jgi:MFS family permease
MAVGIFTLVFHPLAESFVAIAGLRFLNGIGWGMVTTAINAWLTRSLRPEQMGPGVSIFGMSTSIAFAAGPWFGLVLYAHGGMTWVVTGSIALIASVLVPLACAASDGRPQKQVSHPTYTEHTRLGRAQAIPMAFTGIFGFAYISILYFMPAYLVSIHLPGAGYYFFFQAVTAFSVRPIVGRIYARRGAQDLFSGGFLLLALALYMLAYTRSVGMILCSAILFGAGFGSLFSAAQALIVSFFPHHEHGRANALFFNSFDTGIFSGSLLLGFCIEVFGYQLMYLGLAGILLLTAGLSFSSIRMQKASSEALPV